MDLFNEWDFNPQEPALYGRSQCESIPTYRIHIHSKCPVKIQIFTDGLHSRPDDVEATESHSRRKNTRQNRVEVPAPPPHVSSMQGSSLTV